MIKLVIEGIEKSVADKFIVARNDLQKFLSNGDGAPFHNYSDDSDHQLIKPEQSCSDNYEEVAAHMLIQLDDGLDPGELTSKIRQKMGKKTTRES